MAPIGPALDGPEHGSQRLSHRAGSAEKRIKTSQRRRRARRTGTRCSVVRVWMDQRLDAPIHRHHRV